MHYNSLDPKRPNARPKKLKKFAVLDIETNNWKEYVVGGIYDGKEFKHFETLKGLCDAIDNEENTTFFAHFGGIFDFLFLLNYFSIEKIPPESLFMRGSSILSFKYGSNTFYDSAGILPFSLDKATKSFGVSHLKLSIDHTKKKRINKELIRYLKNDCVGLYEVIEKFFASDMLRDVNFKSTVASLSVELLRNYITAPIPSINSKTLDAFVRRGYAGGRVEVLRPISDGPELRYYDFNSLYPSCMFQMDVPLGVKKYTKNISELSFNEVEVEVPKDDYFPLLWEKNPKMKKIIFPTGKIRGVFPGIELMEAEKYGAKITKITKGVEFKSGGRLFKDYVHDLYSRRINSNDEVEKVLCKLFLNAGYGRMAIRRDRETLVFDDGRLGVTPIDVWIGKYRLAKVIEHFRGFSHPAIGALVTAHGRIKLHRSIKPIEREVFYCDTDSIITTRELPHGTILGDLKLEKTETQFCAFTNKAYVFGSDKKWKGMPKEFVQALTFRDYQMALEGEISMIAIMDKKLHRVKSSRSENFLRTSELSTRGAKSRYDKRILEKTNGIWSTRPIHNE